MSRGWCFDDALPKCDQQAREAFERGERICRECAGPVQPPRRSWCSQECVDAYKNRARPVRSVIWERDKGVCAECGHQCTGGAYDEDSNWKHDWEADHIVPLVEGGQHLASNVRTLCLECHKRATADLRKRLRREPTPA